MKIGRAAIYAIQAVSYMATHDPGKLWASHEVARAQRIPERFLLKVLKPLVSAQLLHSLRGPNGGYRLARPAKDISVLAIVEAVDGPIRGQVEFAGEGQGPAVRKLQAIFEQDAEETRRRLQKVSIAHLTSKGK